MPVEQAVTGLDPVLMDVAQLLAWLATICSGSVLAFKAIREVQENRRWRKADLARQVLTSMRAQKLYTDALTMLDWTGREYEVLPGKPETITWAVMEHALRTKEAVSFMDKEVYVRDCFDALFDNLELLENYVRTGLLDFGDLEFVLEYWIGKIREREVVMVSFITEYGYGLAEAFMARFPRDTNAC